MQTSPAAEPGFKLESFAQYIELVKMTEPPIEIFLGQFIDADTPMKALAPFDENMQQCEDRMAGWDMLVNNDLFRLLHASIGLSTESAEIMQAWQAHRHGKQPVDEQNIKEEIGDAFWYFAVACDVANISAPKRLVEDNICSKKGFAVDRLVVTTGLLSELVKKRCFYPCAIEAVHLDARLRDIGGVLNDLCSTFGLLPFDVMEANIRKLHLKRYKGGTFSTEAAVNRDTAAEMEAIDGKV